MKSTKYLLIGGGLASSQAAKQLRAHDRRGAITLVGEEPYVPYDRPPLSKEFLRGEKRRDELFFDPEQYFHDQDILFRGRFENRSFTVFYLKRHILTAYFAVNASSKEFPILQHLIRHKRDLAGRELQLQDPTYALKGLL